MSRIVLIKTPETFSDFNGSKTTCGEKVVGIYQLGSKTVTEHGYRPTGREDEEEFNLDDFTSNRLLEFYNRCYAAKPQDRPYYNCHLLAWFITGSITCLKKYDDYYSDQNKLVDDAAFLPGKTYAVVSSERNLIHSMIGIERSDYSLSVVGDYKPLAIISNGELLALYGGVALNATKPESASCNN